MSSLSQRNKRARPVVSCLRCREKKLKCDRVDPCENCVKAGSVDCAYNQHPGPVPRAKRIQLTTDIPQHSDQNANSIGIIEDVQQRLARVEELLAIRNASSDPLIQNSWRIDDPPSPNLQSCSGTLVVKGSRSRYHGQNGRITLLNQFEEAKAFVNQCSKDSSIVKLAKEVQSLQSKSNILGSPESISELESFPELLQLLQSLPNKEVCDRLLTIYTTNFEKTLRVLHVPTFLRQYDHFWDHSDHESYLASPFIPQLTATLAISITLGDKVIEVDHFSSWEYLKFNAVNLLQSWLQKLPRKHRTELATLQIETLILLARQLRLLPPEECWKGAGSLVRSAMVMGLHIDMPGSAKMSFYQAELRRRLWLTITEIDLQASITSGMPITTPQLNFQSSSPANLHDSEFDETTTELPVSRPVDEKTDTLALITLGKSLSDRINVVNSVLHTNPNIDSREPMRRIRTLEKYLREIPHPLRLNQTSNSQTDLPVSFGQFLTDLYIRRPLLCLYRSVNKGLHSSALADIQQASLESSLTILSYQDYFDPSLADLDTQNTIGYWNMFYAFCRSDTISAALSVCEHMKLSAQVAEQATDSPEPTTHFSIHTSPMPSHSKASLIRIVEHTLDRLSRRIGEAGSNVKDVVLLAVVLQSVRGRGSLEAKHGWMAQGAKKALSACRQYLLVAGVEPSSFDLHQPDPLNPSTLRSQVSTPDLAQMPELLQPSVTVDFANFLDFQGDLFSFDDDAFV